ncbi:putative transporter [Bacteroides sedimenti]|uniref:Transporter n=1 Tax=Bacteroides sedimenti TaxID=2136147 RepID=A0ABM8IJN8_9BACE
MNWLQTLLTDPNSVAHIVALYAFVIAAGVLLGKIKFFGISLGVTFVLFVGILVGHFGLTINTEVLHFMRDFGLILFVFCIGLQVGPSFFSSFKKGGMRMNMLAACIVFLNIAVALGLYYALNGRIQLPMIVGILSGAVTNTPGLGAAQEALNQLQSSGVINEVPKIALGYAVAYPLGVVGIIGAIILIRFIFRIDFSKEEAEWNSTADDNQNKPRLMHIEVDQQGVFGKKISEVMALSGCPFVVSRILKNDKVTIPSPDTILEEGNQIFVVCSEGDAETVINLIGKEVFVNWEELDSPMISRRVLVTKSEMNGKKLGSLKLRNLYGVNITRINRSGVDLFANPNLVLQVGDRVTVVGAEDSVQRVADVMGNSMKRLNEPNIVTIFIGILFGILFGSLPFAFPGIPTPVKLGLAGGPLVVSILIGRFGYKFNLVTYTTQSANLMMREIGITLFLASVGIGAGGEFFKTVVEGDGLLWVGCGFLITFIPLIIVGIVGRKYFKINYFMLMGLIAGSNTDPPALAYSSQVTGSDAPGVGYSTVYPLVMFLRVLSAQLIILMFM